MHRTPSLALRGMAAAGATVLFVAGPAAATQATATPVAPAMATAGCPGDGKVGSGAACTSLSGGALFHYKFNNGTRFEVVSYYQKTGGSKITAQLGYAYRNRNTWGSKFTQTAGSRKTTTWHPAGISQCSPTVGLLRVDGQGTFQTPLANC